MATCPTCRTRYPDDVTTCSADGAALLADQAVAAADLDLVPGQAVGEYRVEGKLGEGGFGAVYRAVHPLIGKTAAIKVLHKQYSSNPQMVSRFIAEARAVNQIRNRNIIDIFSFGALEDGRQYYVMELLDGMTMDAYRKKKGRLSIEEAMPIFRGIARALDAAHQNGIAHRDLKPENVFLQFDDDGTIFPKLLDFGIAKLLGESMASHKTRTGTPMGTPYYMSPEQCRGRNVDHRTDVYSFGILVFETLAGTWPFDGEDVMEILIKHTSAPPPRISDVCRDLPAALDAPILAFLEKEPDKRPPTVSAGLDALANAAASAGFDVKPSGRSAGHDGAASGPKPRAAFSGAASTSGPQAQVRVGASSTPDAAAVAGARTVVQSEGDAGRTMLAAAADVKPSGGRKTMVFVGAVAVVGLLGAAAVAMRGGASTGKQNALASTVVVTATATAAPAATTVTPVVSVAPQPSAPPPSVATTGDTPPPDIQLTIDSEPKIVEVWQGPTKLGTTERTVKLPRSSEKVKLTFKAPGYAPQTLDVTPNEDASLKVRLLKPAAPGGGKRPEVEF
jgi:serine/threonine-protein kinase